MPVLTTARPSGAPGPSPADTGDGIPGPGIAAPATPDGTKPPPPTPGPSTAGAAERSDPTLPSVCGMTRVPRGPVATFVTALNINEQEPMRTSLPTVSERG